MKSFYLFLLIIFSSQVYGQNQKLVIKDSISNKPIPLVAVEYLDSRSGGFTDDEGVINILETVSKIKMSCIGYSEKTLDLKPNDSLIYLIPKLEKLDEVDLSSSTAEIEEFKSKIVKKKVSFKTNTEGFVFAKKVENIKSKKILKIAADINNDDITKKIILKFYDVNSSGKPGEEITKKHHYFTFSPNQKGIEIDFEDQFIYFENEACFIVLVIVSENLEENSKVEIGMNKSKVNDSYFKPFFSKNQNWNSFPYLKKEKFSNFNINVLTTQLD